MRVGVHLYRFDSVEPTALRQELADAARAAEDSGVAWVSVMDHYFQMIAAGFPADDPMLEAYTTLGYLAGVTSRGAARRAGHGRDLPAPRPAGEDPRHPRRALRRPGDARDRGRLVRGGAPRDGGAVPAAVRAVRAPRGDAADLPADVGPDERRPLRRHALPAGPDPVLAAAADAPRDPHRRLGRAQDPAPGRAVRRTRATCSRPRPTRSRTSSRSCAATAPTSAATPPRSA